MNHALLAARPGPRQGERGSMMLMALIVLTLMIVLVSDVKNVARIEYEASLNAANEVKLTYALTGGYEIAKAHIIQDSKDTDIDSLSDSWNQPIKQQFAPDASSNAIGGVNNAYTSSKAPGTVDVTIEIEDEDRKWPLGWFAQSGTNDAVVKLRKQGLTTVIDSFRENNGPYDVDSATAERIADAIVAFMGRKPNESDGVVPRPNTKSDLHILNVADLALIKEVDDRIFFDEVDDEGNIVPGLLRYLTISSDLQVNINTAPIPVLRGIFRSEEKGRGDDLYKYRTDDQDEKAKDKNGISDRLHKDKRGTDKEDEDRTGGATFQKVDDVQKIPTFAGRVLAEAKPLMTVNSKSFSIWVTAQIGNIRRVRHWIVRREGARIVLVLSEGIDPDIRPRYREPSEEELQHDPTLKRDRHKR